MGCFLAGVAATLALALPSSAAEDSRSLAQEAKALVERHEAAQAFRLLEPYEDKLGGDVEFDYWFGVAALESDRLDRAVIAFERVLVRRPDFDSARLELARTYLRMGALDVAAQEFQRLAARAPNEQGRKLIEDYLAQIERLKRRQRLAVGGYVEVGGGRDTNLSSTTSDFSGAILTSFGLPGIQPTGNSIRRADNFLAANAGGDVVYGFAPDRAVLAAANVRWRGYRDFSDFDYVLGDFIGAWRMRAGDVDYLFAAMLQSFRQDGAVVDTLRAARGANDRDAAGVSVEARREVSPGMQAALGVALTQYKYRSKPGQDTPQVVLSAGFERKLASFGGSTIGARAFYAQDAARRPLNPFTE